MLVMLVAMMIIFFMTVAFSVDIAYMQLVRGELRTATDAAAKAASEALARTQDRGQSVARGQEIALLNLVAGKGLALENSDFQFGNSKRLKNNRFAFDSKETPINSVRVVGRRTANSRSGTVGLFFGRILGRSFFEPTESAVATFVERDVVVVVDRSGSMAGQKFADLRNAMQVFVDTLAIGTIEERVGLASYSSTASEDVQFTTDLKKITQAMKEMVVGGRTSISAGMEAGQNIVRRGRSRDFVERTMVVMTDGIHNTGPEPAGAAIALAAEGVVIHTITFGSDADRARMQNIATIGKGRSFHADNGAQLAQAFREIAMTLNTILTE